MKKNKKTHTHKTHKMALYSSPSLICLISLQKPHDPKCLHMPDLKWTNNLDCTEGVKITFFKWATHRGLLATSCFVHRCFAVKLQKYFCGLKTSDLPSASDWIFSKLPLFGWNYPLTTGQTTTCNVKSVAASDPGFLFRCYTHPNPGMAGKLTTLPANDMQTTLADGRWTR